MTRLHPSVPRAIVAFLSASLLLGAATFVAARAQEVLAKPGPAAWQREPSTLLLKDVLLRSVDAKRNSIDVTLGAERLKNAQNSIDVTLGAERLKNAQAQAWHGHVEVKEGALYLVANGTIIRVPTDSAQLNSLPLASATTIIVDGQAGSIADLKPMSVITMTIVSSDNKVMEVREIRATTAKPAM